MALGVAGGLAESEEKMEAVWEMDFETPPEVVRVEEMDGSWVSVGVDSHDALLPGVSERLPEGVNPKESVAGPDKVTPALLLDNPVNVKGGLDVEDGLAFAEWQKEGLVDAVPVVEKEDDGVWERDAATVMECVEQPVSVLDWEPTEVSEADAVEENVARVSVALGVGEESADNEPLESVGEKDLLNTGVPVTDTVAVAD